MNQTLYRPTTQGNLSQARGGFRYAAIDVAAAVCKCGITGPHNVGRVDCAVERDWDCGICGGAVMLLLRGA